jgi:dihydrodipicolinate synthase/N-acetylneuraminate lyase
MNSKEIKDKVQGPIFPLITPFIYQHGIYRVDKVALNLYLDFLIYNGAKVIMVASATSRFAQLSLEEIIELNREVIKHVGQRALVIASTPILGSTEDHIKVASAAEKHGAQVIACEYPWRYQNEKGYIQYFKDIILATKKICIFLHVTPARSELGGWYRGDVDTLNSIVQLSRVVGIKEASGEKSLSKKIWLALANKTNIIVAGRASETFLFARKIESKIAGFFVGTGNIDPESSVKIYSLIQKKDFKHAEDLIKRFETPFLDLAKKYGWHASLKCGLSYLNLMTEIERPPMVKVNKLQSKNLRKIMIDVGWIKN